MEEAGELGGFAEEADEFATIESPVETEFLESEVEAED